LLIPGRPVFMAVADGMGGFEAGDVASWLAVDTVRSWLEEQADPAGPYAAGLAAAYAAANTAIYERAVARLGYPGMGTTLTAALCDGRRLTIGHVGDSRAYLARSGSIRRLTADHSVVGAMVQNGELGEHEAMRHPQRNLLTRALGTEPRIAVDTADYMLQPGDVIILCSDGLSNLVASEELLEAVTGCSDLAALAAHLVGLANARGGNDNVTVLVASFQWEAGGEGA